MDVDGILRAKGATVVTIRPDATIRELVQSLRDERIGAIVVSEDGRSVQASSRSATWSAGSRTTDPESWRRPSPS